MLIIAGELRVDPDERERYLADCVTVIEQARSAPGCLDFALSPDLVDADRINVYERWEDDESLAAFRGSGPSGDQQAQILSAQVRKHRVSLTEAP